MHFFHPDTFAYFKYLDFTFEGFFDSYYDQQHDRVESYYRLKEARETGEDQDNSTFDDNVFSDYETLFDGQDGDLIVSICADGGISPPFVYEQYFDWNFVYEEYFTEGKEYKLAPPFFFDLEGEFFYMPEQRVDQSGGNTSPLIYRLSSISFPEFVSALLWKIFSTKPSNLFSEEYYKINSWGSAFLAYFLNPHFFDTLCSLNVTFSAEELSSFQGILSVEMMFFKSAGLLGKYKDSVGASKFSCTLSKLLTVIGFDSEKALELAREYTCTEDNTELSSALSSESVCSLSHESVPSVPQPSIPLKRTFQ